MANSSTSMASPPASTAASPSVAGLGALGLALPADLVPRGLEELHDVLPEDDQDDHQGDDDHRDDQDLVDALVATVVGEEPAPALAHARAGGRGRPDVRGGFRHACSLQPPRSEEH